METAMQIFTHTDFGELNVILVGGKPEFPATKCAELLTYGNPKQAILDHCRWVAKRDLPHPQSPSKILQVNYIKRQDAIKDFIDSICVEEVNR